MKDLENIYDEQISPLMQKIIDICKEYELPMFASFEFNDGEFCTTELPFDGHVVFQHYSAIKQVTQGSGINIDAYMFWVMRKAKEIGHSSIILNQLSVPEQPEESNPPEKEQ